MDKTKEIMQVIGYRGRNPVQGNMYNRMSDWLSWYRGNVNDFHDYKVKTLNGTTSNKKRLSLQMAKKVCEDWATLLWNEEVTMTIKKNETLNNRIQEVLEENDFRLEFSLLLEKVFALGTGVLIEYTNNGEVKLDYITGDMTIVTNYRNQKIFGICTVNTFTRGEENFTQLTYHDYENGIYKIDQEVYASKDKAKLGRAVSLDYAFPNTKVQESIQFRTKTPHFQVIRPNIANNFELENPLGMSVFGNSIDTQMAIDKKYDSFTNEYDAARHRIFINSEASQVQMDSGADGNVRMISHFDTEQMEYQSVPMGDKAIEFYNADIRADQHIKGISNELQMFGFKCGLGTDYYSFDARGVYQNEKAVVSENSDLWANKKKHEIVLMQVLRDMCKSIAFLLTGTDLDNDDIEIGLADSLIIDDEALYQKDLDLIDREMLTKWEFLMKWEGLSEAEAKARVERATQPSISEMVFEDEIPEDVDEIEEVEETEEE